jgi:hypothetical protein
LLVFHLGDVDGFPIRAAETEVAGHGARKFDSLEDFAFGRQLEDSTGAVARDIEIPVDVAADAIKAVFLEGNEDAFIGNSLLIEIVGEDASLLALGDKERFSVGADFDPVGGSNVVG